MDQRPPPPSPHLPSGRAKLPPFAVVALVWLAQLLLVAVPLIQASQGAPPGAVFNGHFNPLPDLNARYSFLAQTADGRWLLRNNNTPEPHEATYFNPEYVVLGALPRWLGVPLEASVYLWGALGNLALLAAFWALAGRIHAGRGARTWLLLLYAFGGGFGWLLDLLGGSRPFELAANLHPFAIASIGPHESWANALLAWAMVWFLRGLDAGAPRPFLISGALAAFAGSFLPFELVVYGLVVGCWGLLDLARGRLTRLRLTCLAAAVALPTLVLGYQAYLFQLHPVFKWWGIQNQLAPPGLAHLLGSLGLPLLLALAGLTARGLGSTRAGRLPLLWAGVVLGLVYSFQAFPFSLQFTGLLATPVYLLAGAALFRYRGDEAAPRPPLLAKAGGRWVLAGLLALASLTTLYRTATLADHARSRPPMFSPYLGQGWVAASDWLRDHSARDAVVLAPLRSANWLPRTARRATFAGYLFNTVDFNEKARLTTEFFRWNRPEENLRLLEAYGVDYVWEDAPGDEPRPSYLEAVFRNEEVALYRVR